MRRRCALSASSSDRTSPAALSLLTPIPQRKSVYLSLPSSSVSTVSFASPWIFDENPVSIGKRTVPASPCTWLALTGMDVPEHSS